MLISADAFVLIVVACMLIIGCTFWIRQARANKWLAHNGKRVAATVTCIEQQAGPGFTCYIVAARWTDPQTNTSYTFESDPDPRPPQERYAEGSPVNVLLDPANPRCYHMEVERSKSNV